MSLALAAALAFGHGSEFGSSALRGRDAAPDELWMLSSGWGVLHSVDAGANWAWICEEVLATEGVYDVEAWGDGQALVGMREGMSRLGDDCSVQAYAGLEGGFVLRAVRFEGWAVALWVGDGEGGVFACEADSCVATPLAGAGFFPKSAFVDGGTLYVTLVHTDTLAAELYATADLVTWEQRHAWPLGDSDPRVLWARGDDLYAWVRPRDDAALPAFLKSTDGGRSFTTTFEAGYYTDPEPGALVLDAGQTVFLGSVYGARTWRSTDAGASFAEVSADYPAVRCGLVLGERAYACGDHLADGFDVSVSTNGRDFEALACIEEARPAECAEPACASYVDAWVNAGAYGGGECDAANDDTATGASGPGDACGCGNGAAAALGLAALASRYRRAPSTRKAWPENASPPTSA